MEQTYQNYYALSTLGVMLTSDLHQVARLKMSGAITLLPLYASVAWKEKTLLTFSLLHGIYFFMRCL